MKLLYTIIGMLVVLFVITFSLTNTVPVQLKYYDIIDITVPTYMLIFISFGVGILFAGFLDIVQRISLKRKVTRLNRRVKALEKGQGETPVDSEEAEVLPPDSDELTV